MTWDHVKWRLNNVYWTLDSRKITSDNETPTLDNWKQTLVKGKLTLDNKKTTLETRKLKLHNKKPSLGYGKLTFDNGIVMLVSDALINKEADFFIIKYCDVKYCLCYSGDFDLPFTEICSKMKVLGLFLELFWN